MSRKKSSLRFRFSAASVLLSGLLFLLPALLNQQEDASRLYWLAALVPGTLLLCETALARMFSLDRMILSLSLWLCAAGTAALIPSGADAALAQALLCGAGIGALLLGGVLIRSLSPSLLTAACSGFLGLLALSSRLLVPDLDLPLSEAALALVLIAFASLLSCRGPVSALLLGTSALALLLLSGDIASALFWGLVLLLLILAADGRLIVSLSAAAAVLLVFLAAFLLFPSAFSLTGAPVISLADTGWVGSQVLPESIPSADPDSLFLPLCGYYGLIFSGLTALLFLPLSLRGGTVAAFARTRFHAVLAMGATLLLALRALSAMLSAFGFLPLPGLRLPFLTASPAELCGEMFLAGLLCGISGRNEADLAEDAHLAMLAR